MITYIDRLTGQKQIEKVYGEKALHLLYGSLFGKPLMHAAGRLSFISALYGYLQKRKSSQAKVQPFIEAFGIDPNEFLESHFDSFNDFFIRKLKPEARPMEGAPAVIPADARYYFHQNIAASKGFIVKGQKFSLEKLLQSKDLAERYKEGAMVMARLCPVDYHRFHFPCACVPGGTQIINGWLYSVNPIALKQNIHIFTENKRTLCELDTQDFGKVLYMEVGATNVGSIVETYVPGVATMKGAEKGYFEFGASALIILFEKDRIVFDSDLVAATEAGLEIRCLLGQSMGKRK